MKSKTVNVGFPNEGTITMMVNNVKKWKPTKIHYLDNVVFFKSDNSYFSLTKVDFNKIFDIHNK